MKSVAESWLFRRRDWLGVLCLVRLASAVLLSPPWTPEGGWVAVAKDWVAWLFFFVYMLLRIWATLFAGGRKDRLLQTEGPYSITRNPLYLGSFFLALSCCAFLQSPILLIGVGLLYIFYARGVVTAEERMLLQLFPQDYPGYLSRTPRFIPRFSLYQGPAQLMVNLTALKRETKRLAGAILIPLGAEALGHLRSASWWPHFFSLF